LFCIPAFIWRPTRGGLLNLAKPAQKLLSFLFFAIFFQIFKESVTECSLEIFIFRIWRNFVLKTKTLSATAAPILT
jgi:hypothetical protein